MAGKGSGRRMSFVALDEYNDNFERAFGKIEVAADVLDAQIQTTIAECRDAKLTDEEIEAIMEERYGISEPLEDYEDVKQ